MIAILGTEAGLTSASGLSIKAPDFATNGAIPTKFSCAGSNTSPALMWSGVPAAAKALALIVRDPDAPMGSYVHWVLYNLPARATGLPAAIPATGTLDSGAVQGANGSGEIGYQGPCPPPGPVHHYHFRLYALDTKLELMHGAKAAAVERAMEGHVLASADLVGTFAR
ncbi:MAG TPA: YbhB/YbcL family Raf kinase inhibitor-like protein [Candidatus Binataceae bacterium]|nr:YbhB/YbcL family Raf kinase inhibitor-like protein [Candidatus Binataceae bacterium]